MPVSDRRRMNNEINPPEVLSTQDSQLRRKKQHNKSKENRTLNLSGNVDLGLTKKSLRKKNLKSLMTSTTTMTPSTTTTTTEHPNEIPTNYQQPSPPPSSNHHRHNHNTDFNRYRVMMTSTQYPIAYQLPSSPPVTTAPLNNETSSSSATSAKQVEKVT